MMTDGLRGFVQSIEMLIVSILRLVISLITSGIGYSVRVRYSRTTGDGDRPLSLISEEHRPRVPTVRSTNLPVDAAPQRVMGGCPFGGRSPKRRGAVGRGSDYHVVSNWDDFGQQQVRSRSVLLNGCC